MAWTWGRWLRIGVLLAAGALVGAVLSSVEWNPASSGTSAARPAGAGEGTATLVPVSLTELKITPAVIALPAAKPTTLQVRNAGQAAHSMAVEAAGRTLSTPELAPGGTATLRLPGLTPGSYRAWCTVPGHREAGMTATLTVSATTKQAATPSAAAPSQTTQMTGMPMAAAHDGAAMAAAHERSMRAFPATTRGHGNQLQFPTIDRGVKVFHLVAGSTRWEVAPGDVRDAQTFNGQVPGPQLRVRRGDRVRVVVDNRLQEPTTVHFHGLTVPNAADGVPYVTQPPIMPGQRYTYEFTVVDPPGTYLYHSHFNSAEQVGRGLYGVIVVEPAQRSWQREYTVLVNDGSLGYTINGKGFPATEPLLASRGQRVLIRLGNIGQMLHPFHLHGYHFQVVAKDGQPEPRAFMADTLVVAPGERYDVLVDATQPGVWAFHCHVLSHVEGPQGMFGMATALIVK
jgi:uncharacterized cupredoxin-like copper-binding protein